MKGKPYAVPTALTHLWRAPAKRLIEGDGVVLIFPDGTQRHGTVAGTQIGMAVIEHSGGTVLAEVKWEGRR